MRFSNRLSAGLIFLTCVIIAGGLAHRLAGKDSHESSSRPDISTVAIPAPAPESLPGPAPGLSESPRNELPALLAAGRFEDAIENHDRSSRVLDELDVERGRAAILAYAASLIEQDRVARAEDLLRLYTDLFFQDTEAMLMMAEALAAQGLLADGLDYLVQARNMAYTEEQVIAINRQLIIAARTYRTELESYEDRHGILAIYQMLYNQYPDIGEFSLELARANAALGRPQEAYSLLQQLRLDPGYQQRAEDYLKILQPELAKSYANSDDTATPMEIPLVPHGRQYSISANVDGAEVALLLDTGASITTLTPEIIRKISARSSNRTITLQTANGPTQSKLYRVRQFSLGSVKLHNFELASIPLTGMTGIDGLLGTDFLRLFNYTINNQTDTLVLAPVQVIPDPTNDPG